MGQQIECERCGQRIWPDNLTAYRETAWLDLDSVRAGEPVVRLIAVEQPWVRFAVLADDLGEVALGDPVEITPPPW